MVSDAVDALWVCYADDCELCTCAQPEVHSVYAQLPSVGRLVTDAGYHYSPAGRPVTPPAPLPESHYSFVTVPGPPDQFEGPHSTNTFQPPPPQHVSMPHS
uniref:Uncharacterized protein n=1 Tax=Chlamydomonas leiostraca TaxID=1034604 RepID=A0A7S0S588_9CHLO